MGAALVQQPGQLPGEPFGELLGRLVLLAQGMAPHAVGVEAPARLVRPDVLVFQPARRMRNIPDQPEALARTGAFKDARAAAVRDQDPGVGHDDYLPVSPVLRSNDSRKIRHTRGIGDSTYIRGMAAARSLQNFLRKEFLSSANKRRCAMTALTHTAIFPWQKAPADVPFGGEDETAAMVYVGDIYALLELDRFLESAGGSREQEPAWPFIR